MHWAHNSGATISAADDAAQQDEIRRDEFVVAAAATVRSEAEDSP